MVKRKTTKELLWDSLLELTKKKSYNKITVRDIAKNAGISTVTFYNHFNSKADLYYWCVYENGKKYYSMLNEHYTWYNYILDVFEESIKEKEMTLNIVSHSEGYESSIEVAYRSNVELMVQYIEEHEGKAIVTEDLLLVIRTYLYGILHVIDQDVRSGMKMDRQKLARQITLAMPEILKTHIPI